METEDTLTEKLYYALRRTGMWVFRTAMISELQPRNECTQDSRGDLFLLQKAWVTLHSSQIAAGIQVMHCLQDIWCGSSGEVNRLLLLDGALTSSTLILANGC